MAGPIRFSVVANASQAKRELNSVSTTASRMGTKFASIAKGAAVTGLVVAGAAAVKFGVDTIKAASDAQQSIGATETVFGQFADKVIKTSEEAAQRFGLSANEYRDSANLIGSLFKNQGVALDELAGKTESMVSLGSDLAATFGGETSDAVAALGSAFKGEFDTLERYGVSIKQSEVNAVLAARGQDDLTGASLKLAQQAAVTDLIMKQSKDNIGAFARESDTLAGQQQRLAAEFENVKTKIGTALMPVIMDAIGWFKSDAMPAISEFVGELKRIYTENKGTFDKLGEVVKTFAKIFGGTVLLALKLAVINFEAMITSIKFAGNVFYDFSQAVLTVFGTVVDTITSAVGDVIGAFVDLAEAADSIPGVDLSGVVDSLKSIQTRIKGAGDTFHAMTDQWKTDIETQQILWNLSAQEMKKLENQILALPKDVRTAIETPGAVESAFAVQQLTSEYALTPDEVVTVMRAVGTDLSRKHVLWLQDEYDLTPEQITTVFNTTGSGVSRKEAKALQKTFDLTPRQVRTLFKETGADRVKKQARDVKKNLQDTGKVVPNFIPFNNKIRNDVFKAANDAKKGADKANKHLKDTGNVKPDFNPFNNSVKSAIDQNKTRASTGGREIGTSLKTGVLGGLSGLLPALSANVQAAVNAAIAAGKRAAKAHSPSKRMMDLGRDLSDGLVLGMARGKSKQEKAGKDAVRSLLAGVIEGSAAVEKSLSKITALVEKRIKGKDEDKREKRVLAHLKDEYNALQKSGKALDKNNEKLSSAVQKLKDVKKAAQDYANSIRDSVVAFGSVVAVGQGTGFGSLEQMIDQMRARVEQAKKYSALIKQLAAAGLNATTIQQLLDASVEGGLGTAETILSGGIDAINEINQLTQELTATGTGLGNAMSKEFKQAGIDAARALVQELRKSRKDLREVARDLANDLVRAIKDALGIKSPSKVFRDIGDQTVKGLVLGLDETYVARSGASLAASLQKGFGTPALEAYAAQNATSGSGTTVQVRLTADQVSQLQRGKEIQLALDVYNSVGGRAGA